MHLFVPSFDTNFKLSHTADSILPAEKGASIFADPPLTAVDDFQLANNFFTNLLSSQSFEEVIERHEEPEGIERDWQTKQEQSHLEAYSSSAVDREREREESLRNSSYDRAIETGKEVKEKSKEKEESKERAITEGRATENQKNRVEDEASSKRPEEVTAENGERKTFLKNGKSGQNGLSEEAAAGGEKTKERAGIAILRKNGQTAVDGNFMTVDKGKNQETPSSLSHADSHTERGSFRNGDSGAQKSTEQLVQVLLDGERWKINANKINANIEAKRADSFPGGREKLTELAFARGARAGNKKQSGQTKGEETRAQTEQSGQNSVTLQSQRELSFLSSHLPFQGELNEQLQELRQREETLQANRRLYSELVEKARVNLRSDGSSTATIRMRPPSLGYLTLNLEVDQKRVAARLVVESESALRILKEEMEYIRQELLRQGVQVESISIRLRDTASLQAETDKKNETEGEGATLDNSGEDNSNSWQSQQNPEQEIDHTLQWREEISDNLLTGRFEGEDMDWFNGLGLAVLAEERLDISI